MGHRQGETDGPHGAPGQSDCADGKAKPRRTQAGRGRQTSRDGGLTESTLLWFRTGTAAGRRLQVRDDNRFSGDAEQSGLSTRWRAGQTGREDPVDLERSNGGRRPNTSG
ncbi:hypothetical protein [Kibdelosporangium philippinense]|uniref:hypothetical protein n=1 Tax=Kibdelosporangium philippinense TaxID=211113 RepID=UPI00361ADB78